MADEPTPQAGTPEPTPDPKADPKAEVPETKGTPTISTKDIEGKTPDEIVKFVSEQSEKHGVTKKQLEDYENYIKQIKPYIDTITESEELTKQVEDAYKKKFNIQQEDKKDTKPPDDTRKAVENSIVSAFETSHDLNKLEGDAKKDMNVRIGQELMELLDPSGTKSYNEVISGVSLEKLPKYLEKAYSLATMNDTIKKAQESAQAEANSGAAGIISSVPSNSPEGTDATLTPTERELAKRMGVSEEKWLERKKQITARNQ